ncbi:MAG TPA: hypothetical protein VFE47_26190 [Tepidisphaeraceae bacterium]|nr:hypothetical protein [Tepidisphaeraceae bacterium]
MFPADQYRQIAHLHWSERDRLIEAASRRVVKQRRWLLATTGFLRLAILAAMLGVRSSSHQPRVFLILLSLLAFSMIFDFVPRRRAMRAALSAELLARGMRPGSCLICGYDLRASRERCPECGTIIAPPLAAENPESSVNR